MPPTSSGPRRRSSLCVAQDALAHRLPARYDHLHRELFDSYAKPLIRSGVSVLDIGAGRAPTFPEADRPPGCTYVGLDLSGPELAAAPDQSYDDFVVSDVTTCVTSLVGQFDVIISWQVLEHVRPLPMAMENLRSYLRPGGQLVAHFSGALGLFGLLSRAVPDRVTPALLEKMFDRPRSTTFPAYYDKCWAGALTKIGHPWSSFQVIPRHEGARYFAFSRHVQAVYLAYEEWAAQNGHDNLASYYLVVAIR